MSMDVGMGTDMGYHTVGTGTGAKLGCTMGTGTRIGTWVWVQVRVLVPGYGDRYASW